MKKTVTLGEFRQIIDKLPDSTALFISTDNGSAITVANAVHTVTFSDVAGNLLLTLDTKTLPMSDVSEVPNILARHHFAQGV